MPGFVLVLQNHQRQPGWQSARLQRCAQAHRLRAATATADQTLHDQRLVFFLSVVAAAGAAASIVLRKRPVCDAGLSATCSGVPSAIITPPLEPPSGPISTSQSAVLITSRLCSIMTTVLPWSRRRCSTSSNC